MMRGLLLDLILASVGVVKQQVTQQYVIRHMCLDVMWQVID